MQCKNTNLFIEFFCIDDNNAVRIATPEVPQIEYDSSFKYDHEDILWSDVLMVQNEIEL